MTRVDDSQRAADRVPAGTEGRVVGFYRLDPPQTLVQFEHGSCPILDSVLQRVA